MQQVAHTVGEYVQYLSKSSNTWMNAKITAVDPQSGCILLNIKPRSWIYPHEQATRIRPWIRRTDTNGRMIGANVNNAMLQVGGSVL